MSYLLKHIIDIFDKIRNYIFYGEKLNYSDKDLFTKLIVILLELNFLSKRKANFPKD